MMFQDKVLKRIKFFHDVSGQSSEDNIFIYEKRKVIIRASIYSVSKCNIYDIIFL
jgi:hypothetical protein